MYNFAIDITFWTEKKTIKFRLNLSHNILACDNLGYLYNTNVVTIQRLTHEFCHIYDCKPTLYFSAK